MVDCPLTWQHWPGFNQSVGKGCVCNHRQLCSWPTLISLCWKEELVILPHNVITYYPWILITFSPYSSIYIEVIVTIYCMLNKFILSSFHPSSQETISEVSDQVQCMMFVTTLWLTIFSPPQLRPTPDAFLITQDQVLNQCHIHHENKTMLVSNL